MPIQIPIGSEENFRGVIDLVGMKAILYRDDLGHDIDVVDIPAELNAEAKKHREAMVEAVAESDDELTHKFLEGEELTEQEIRHGLRLGTLQDKIVPVSDGSALRNKGIQPMLDAVVDYLPSPLDVPPVIGENPRTGGEVLRTRRRQGALRRPGVQDRRRPVRRQARVLPRLLGHAQVRLVRLQRDARTARSASAASSRCTRTTARRSRRSYAGDIAAVVGLKETYTGDTLSDPDHPVVLESMTFPEPVIEVKIEPKTKADQDKLGDRAPAPVRGGPDLPGQDRPGERARR